MASRSRHVTRLVILALVLLVIGWIARPYVDAGSFIIRAAKLGGTPQTIAGGIARPVRIDQTGSVPTRYGPVPSRLYRPARGFSRLALLVPGVHAAGIDEIRLTGLANDLAASGIGVMTMALPDLQRYRITPESTDVIEDAITFVSRRREYAADGKIGVIGISFAGGLSIVAASRPGIRDRVAYVVSFGGHGDLPRVMRFLCTGVQPTGPGLPQTREGKGIFRQPHDYGVAVILYGAAEEMVPPEQVQPLRDGVRTFLLASQETLVDMKRANQMFEQAREQEKALPDPARRLLHWVNERSVKDLGPVLLPHLGKLGGAPALSPERTGGVPSAPVYLLHGADDSVIPAIESQLLGRYLDEHGTTAHVLLSGLITHAEVDKSAAAAETLKLIGFWGSVLRR